MGVEVGGEGGYLVPTQFVSQMLDASLESEVIRPRADVQGMTSNEKHVAGWDTENHSSTIGGFVGRWYAEGDTATVDTGTTRKIILQAKKLQIYTTASNELIADGQDFEGQLSAAMVKRLGWWMDNAFFNGTGAGEPKGVLNDPALIAIAKESGQAADTIVFENLVNAMARVHPASFANSVWVANNNTIPQLLNIQIKIRNDADSDSVGGSHVPVLSDDGRGGFTLLTRPVVFSEKCPTLGDQGDIGLYDFSQYVIGMRPEIGIQKSMHVGFAKDESTYRIIARLDGQGKWSGPVTPAAGSTLSWAVVIAARA